MTQIQQSAGDLRGGASRSLPVVEVLIGMGLMVAVGLFISLSPMLAAAAIFALVGFVVCVALAIYRPIWLVYGLVLFMPFENVVLKFIPGPDQIYLASRFGTEIVIYIGFAVVFVRHVAGGRPLRRTPVDLPLLLFFGLAAFSILINRSLTADTVLNLRSLLRYVALFYWIVNLDIDERQATWILRIILATALLQVGIGALQYVSKGALDPILMPRQSDIEIAGQSRSFRLASEKGREFGAIYGTLGDTLYFGIFMLVALGVYLGAANKISLPMLIGAGAIIVAIAFSYSRAATFGVVLVLGLFAWLRYGSARIARMLLPLLPVMLIAAVLLVRSVPKQQEYLNPTSHEQSVVENMLGIFSSDYVQRAQRQRLGILLGAAPAVLTSKPILGYGPSVNRVIETINKTQADIIVHRLDERTFEDVYWVALLTYYGVLGVAAFALLMAAMFISAFRIAKSTPSRQVRHIAIATAIVVGIAPFLLFFYRAMEFRIFSFYFWLLPALLYAHRATAAKERARLAASAANAATDVHARQDRPDAASKTAPAPAA